MSERSDAPLLRAIGRWSLAALVINSIIGSGIFGLPSIVAGLVGAWSPLAYLLAATGMGLIMACFAEVASRFTAAGGPYLYAREAFGAFFGVQIGWLTWLVRLTAAAANANLFVIYLAEFWPSADDPIPRAALLTLLIGGLAAVNYRGVRTGAQVSNVFAVLKLIPLLLFIGLGFAFMKPIEVRSSTPTVEAWLHAVLVLVYAYGGFEAALLPMAEAKNPRRDAPFALFVALVTVTAIFTLIQVIVVSVLPDAARTERPLATAARAFSGAWGAGMISAGALISVYGYLSSMMLNAPRLTFALAERGDFPGFFAAVHPRFRTPHLSIVVFALLTWGLALAGTFAWNVMLSAVARLFTYASTCLALIVLRQKGHEEPAFRLPYGPFLAVLALAFSLILVTRMGRGEVIVLILTSVLALANWLWRTQRERRRAQVPAS
ncbi:MAG: amino acid permease [Blastocatellia bacterium]|nr:amino acid permease [Blastocatellia bacterium]MCX7752007.1 amino acid permease [Blastocatellia bacterium]MDW8167113.1 amino acid permease [Acidobacteriota bacterium]